MTPAHNRRKGAKAEIEWCDRLIARGLNAVRLHLNGVNDQGDVAVFRGNGRVDVWEVKSGSYAGKLAGWLDELAREVENTRRARPGMEVRGALAIRLRGGRWIVAKEAE